MRWFIPLLAVLLLAGCTAAPRSFTVENGCFEAVLDDPGVPDDGSMLGCRFLRAGWITGLYPAGSEISLLHTRTLYDGHPAFGCAQELTPVLELGPERQLKIGVGVIEPNPVRSFRTKPVELFPWQVDFGKTETQTVMTARQSCGDRNGYAYELTVTVTIVEGEPEIVQEQLLRNTGSRRIEAQAYIHPFFDARNPESCRFRLTGEKSGAVFDLPECVTETYEEECYEVSAEFRTDRDYLVSIISDTPLCSSSLWHNKKNSFAVEPFITVNIAPGEQQKWTWRLVVETR